MKGVSIFLAEGFEDMEALGTRDVLLRAGIPVTTVSITDEYFVTSSHGVTVSVDMNRKTFELSLEEEGTGAADMMIFPGGMPGSKNLAHDRALMELMQRHFASGGSVAAICAAPGLVLSHLDGIEGLKFTCFDGFEEPMIEKGAVYVPDGAVTDGRLITGRGAGHAVGFGLAIVAYLRGEEAAEKVRHGLML